MRPVKGEGRAEGAAPRSLPGPVGLSGAQKWSGAALSARGPAIAAGALAAERECPRAHTRTRTKILQPVSHIIRPGKTKAAVGPCSSGNGRRRFNCRKLSLCPLFIFLLLRLFLLHFKCLQTSLARRTRSNYCLCLQGLLCQSLNGME